MTDRLAPDLQIVSVTGDVSATSTITSASGTVSTDTTDGRTNLATADTETRRLLEDILILLGDISDKLGRS